MCVKSKIWPAHIVVFIAYAQKPLLNANADVSSWARCLILVEDLIFTHAYQSDSLLIALKISYLALRLQKYVHAELN